MRDGTERRRHLSSSAPPREVLVLLVLPALPPGDPANRPTAPEGPEESNGRTG
jgi:hypothetical protein